ncbi:hypothetical protein LL946_17475 [Knoellia locipacati]|uniref:hypothetical protein n=1 Tax=Knoellia locipacati TaxID=882824 RepID=UPI00384F961F
MAGIEVVVHVPQESGEDLDELLDVTGWLRDEFLALDVQDVRPVQATTAPDGAKGVGAIAGWLAVQLASVEGVRAVIELARGWAGQRRREVEITIGGDTLKLSGASAGEQERIIDAWIARHAPGS